MTDSRIIVALDYETAEAALAMARRLDPCLCRVKVGKELFTAAGPEVVRQLVAIGFDVFLDLKFHDIPNTVAKAVRAAADLGVWMVNVHASGGSRMMRAAREALDTVPEVRRPLLTAVTVLTSMDSEDLVEIGISRSPAEQVAHLAELAEAAGMDGVVCSAQEAVMLRQQRGGAFCLVTPGIRLAGAVGDDQRRVCTPVEAVRNGSSYLVIGRPVTQSADPVSVLKEVALDLARI